MMKTKCRRAASEGRQARPAHSRVRQRAAWRIRNHKNYDSFAHTHTAEQRQRNTERDRMWGGEGAAQGGIQFGADCPFWLKNKN